MLPRHTKTFYLIGPPVESASQVADVLNYVLSEMHGTPLEGFQVSQTAGLPYYRLDVGEGHAPTA